MSSIVKKYFSGWSPSDKRQFGEIKRCGCLEAENKIIIDINPWAPFINKKLPPRFN
jgi:hypothetical protein